MHNNEREVLNRIAFELKKMSDLIVEKNHKWHMYANEEFKKKVDEIISIELSKIEKTITCLSEFNCFLLYGLVKNNPK